MDSSSRTADAEAAGSDAAAAGSEAADTARVRTSENQFACAVRCGDGFGRWGTVRDPDRSRAAQSLAAAKAFRRRLTHRTRQVDPLARGAAANPGAPDRRRPLRDRGGRTALARGPA